VAHLKADNAKLRMQYKHMTRDLQAATTRTTETETRAQLLISSLEREVEIARSTSRAPPTENAAQAVHAIGSRQAEVRAYKGATSELRNYVESLAARSERVSISPNSSMCTV
jgi:hypothetical protein